MHFGRTTTLRNAVGVLGTLVGLGLVACTAAPAKSGGATGPVSVNAAADPSTAGATPVVSYVAKTAPGAVTLNAHDAKGAVVVAFHVTKLPGVQFRNEKVPSMIVIMDGTSPTGGQIHTEQMSVYARPNDLTRTEFELYGVGDVNLVVRWSYNVDGLPQRLSMMTFRGTGDANTPRLRQLLSKQVTTTTTVGTAPANADDAIEKWATNNGLSAVVDNPLFDIAYFIQRDPTWARAIVTAIDPKNDALTPTFIRAASTTGTLHLASEGGDGEGSGDEDSAEEAGDDNENGDPDDDADGTPDDEDDDDTDNADNDDDDDDDDCDEDSGDGCDDNPEDDPKGGAGGKGEPKAPSAMMPKEMMPKGGEMPKMMEPKEPKEPEPKEPKEPKPGKPSQLGDCSPESLKGFLDGFAKNPSAVGAGVTSCKTCFSVSSSPAAAPPPSSSSTQAAAVGAGSKAFQSLQASGKILYKPALLGASAACGACAKFMQKAGVTHALSCLLGASANGAAGGASAAKVSVSGKSKKAQGLHLDNVNPLDVSPSAAAWANLPHANTCMTGVKRCAYDLSDRDNSSGAADVCFQGADGNQSCTSIAP